MKNSSVRTALSDDSAIILKVSGSKRTYTNETSELQTGYDLSVTTSDSENQPIVAQFQVTDGNKTVKSIPNTKHVKRSQLE